MNLLSEEVIVNRCENSTDEIDGFVRWRYNNAWIKMGNS